MKLLLFLYTSLLTLFILYILHFPYNVYYSVTELLVINNCKTYNTNTPYPNRYMFLFLRNNVYQKIVHDGKRSYRTESVASLKNVPFFQPIFKLDFCLFHCTLFQLMHFAKVRNFMSFKYKTALKTISCLFLILINHNDVSLLKYDVVYTLNKTKINS